MSSRSAIAFIVLAISFLLVANATAQPLPEGPYPPGPDYLGPDYPGPDYLGPDYPGPDYPGPDYPFDPDYPLGPDYSHRGPGHSTGHQSSEGDHPASGPSSSEPLSAPSASSTEALSFGEGQSLSQQEVASTGGAGASANYLMAVSGLQIWARYNGVWTTGPAAVYYWRSTSTLCYNDQSQNVWSWERYPNGQQSWRNWGYRMPGYFHGRFIGDARGWHQLAMWGRASGWSNVVWIYVW